MTIGQVAKEAGLSASAIRFYEKTGLLPKPRRASGQRRYDGTILERLAVLEFAKECGFSLAEVRALFSGFREDAPLSERMRKLAREKIVELEEQRVRIEVMKGMLERSLSCRCVNFQECAQRIRKRHDSTGVEGCGDK